MTPLSVFIWRRLAPKTARLLRRPTVGGWRMSFNASSHNISGLRSPALASAMSFVAIACLTPSSQSPVRSAMQTISSATLSTLTSNRTPTSSAIDLIQNTSIRSSSSQRACAMSRSFGCLANAARMLERLTRIEVRPFENPEAQMHQERQLSDRCLC
jgi:hypothetical protein